MELKGNFLLSDTCGKKYSFNRHNFKLIESLSDEDDDSFQEINQSAIHFFCYKQYFTFDFGIYLGLFGVLVDNKTRPAQYATDAFSLK